MHRSFGCLGATFYISSYVTVVQLELWQPYRVEQVTAKLTVDIRNCKIEMVLKTTGIGRHLVFVPFQLGCEHRLLPLVPSTPVVCTHCGKYTYGYE